MGIYILTKEEGIEGDLCKTTLLGVFDCLNKTKQFAKELERNIDGTWKLDFADKKRGLYTDRVFHDSISGGNGAKYVIEVLDGINHTTEEYKPNMYLVKKENVFC